MKILMMLLISVGLNAQIADVNSGDTITAQKMNDVVSDLNKSLKDGTGKKQCRFIINQGSSSIDGDFNNCVSGASTPLLGVSTITFEPGFFTGIETCMTHTLVGGDPLTSGDPSFYSCNFFIGHIGINQATMSCKQMVPGGQVNSFNTITHVTCVGY
tara:strand:- start:2201 stop:2671 length:471 start_codon:yes stop_codon:yes gene_type:complete